MLPTFRGINAERNINASPIKNLIDNLHLMSRALHHVWWTIAKTRKPEIEGRVERGQISTQDEAKFPLNANLHSGEGKRCDERVVRSCLGTIGVWATTCPTPWVDSRSCVHGLRAWVSHMGDHMM